MDTSNSKCPHCGNEELRAQRNLRECLNCEYYWFDNRDEENKVVSFLFGALTVCACVLIVSIFVAMALEIYTSATAPLPGEMPTEYVNNPNIPCPCTDRE